MSKVFFESFNGLFVLRKEFVFNAFVFFDLFNKFFVLVFDLIQLFGLLGEFLLKGFEGVHKLLDLVFGIVVLGVLAFE